MCNFNEGLQNFLKENINDINKIKIIIYENSQDKWWSGERVIQKTSFEKKSLNYIEKSIGFIPKVNMFNTDFIYLFYNNWINCSDYNKEEQTLEQFIEENNLLNKNWLGLKKLIWDGLTYLEVYFEETVKEKQERERLLEEALKAVSELTVTVNPMFI